MNKNYSINLRKLILKLENRISKISNQEFRKIAVLYLDRLNEIKADLENKLLVFTTDKKKLSRLPLIINPQRNDFPFLLSLELLLTTKERILHIIKHYENKFISNELIPKARYKKLINTYVLNSIATNGVLLNFSNSEIEEVTKCIDQYFKPLPKNSHPLTDNIKTAPVNIKPPVSYITIVFKFEKITKEELIDGLKKYVVEDDTKYLDILFSEQQPQDWVRFNLQSNQIAELFFRLRKYRVINSYKCSGKQTAKWIADRIKTLKKGTSDTYTTSSHQSVENFVYGKKKLEESKRILLDKLQ